MSQILIFCFLFRHAFDCYCFNMWIITDSYSGDYLSHHEISSRLIKILLPLLNKLFSFLPFWTMYNELHLRLSLLFWVRFLLSWMMCLHCVQILANILLFHKLFVDCFLVWILTAKPLWFSDFLTDLKLLGIWFVYVNSWNSMMKVGFTVIDLQIYAIVHCFTVYWFHSSLPARGNKQYASFGQSQSASGQSAKAFTLPSHMKPSK